ncbi:MAG TPA: GNAT family N-acetyltransferase [Prolixibacteraceae bacterium]|nr:GNAT family N-acetyltransferase [Prolixibacteraceae bacterium]
METKLSIKNKLSIKIFTGSEALMFIDDLAQLRITVFKEYPYLYQGSVDYEKKYLKKFAVAKNSVMVIAFDGEKVIGVSTGLPLVYETDGVTKPWVDNGHSLDDIFYFGESVLLKEYRRNGLGNQFFIERENWARKLGAFNILAFCAVIRENNHPLKPADYFDLAPFWKRKGFEPMHGYICNISWQEIGEQNESNKPLQFWYKKI